MGMGANMSSTNQYDSRLVTAAVMINARMTKHRIQLKYVNTQYKSDLYNGQVINFMTHNLSINAPC